MTKKNYIPSFLIAYLLSISGLNQLIGIVLGRKDGIMIMNLIPIAGLCLLHFFISNKKRDLNLNKKALFFVYYIISVIVIYKYSFRYTTIHYEEFLVYCFIPIYLSFYKVDAKRILEFMMIFSVMVLPVSNDFFKTGGFGYETIGMSTTYNILPFVVAVALHFWCYRKGANMFVWAIYALNVYYLAKVVFLGNRGPIISLTVLGVLFLLHNFYPDGTMKKSNLKTILISVLVGYVVVYFINNLEEILYSVNDWLVAKNMEISAISKSIQKLEDGDISNGRDFLFDFVTNGIKEHYLVGNGIGTIYYNSRYRYIYPHNLFLQLWYDIGIIVSIPMFWLIGKATYITAFKNNISKNRAVLMILLFTLSVPRLCYSAEFWVNIPFWLLIMFAISPNIYENDDDAEVVESDTKNKENVV